MAAEYVEPVGEQYLNIRSVGSPGEMRPPWRFSRAVVENLKEDGVWVRKTDNIHLLDGQNDQNLTITMTLCPLYEIGSLSDSHLMAPPARIEQSRVAEKWKTGIRAVESIQRTNTQRGQSVNVALTFADLGTISRNPGAEEPAVLDYHFQVYRDAAERELGERGISFELGRYSDLAASHPRFIPASEQVLFLSPNQVSAEADEMIRRLAGLGVQFDPSSVDVEGGVMTKRARRIIEGLMRIKGNPEENGYSIELAEGLIAQYGIFDAQTSRPDGLNLFIERESAGLLLQVTDLFAHSRAPRVDILV